MALLGASFQIGRSAMAAYQAALAVAGQNLANVGNPNYTRQTGRLEAQPGGPVLGGVAPGSGVRLTQLNRHIDEALESRLRSALSSRSRSEVLYQSLTQTEALYNELTEGDLSTQLSEMFGKFGGLQAEPKDSTARDLVISSADAVIATLKRQRSGLQQQVIDLNTQAGDVASEANRISNEIARLNGLIVSTESDGVSIASPLRDQRDALLRDLSEIMDIQTREQDTGAVNVYVGSEPLVEFNRSRGVTVIKTLQDGLEIGEVRFADNEGTITVRQGKLAGMLAARDTYVRDQLERLDTLARGMIFEVNKLHAGGAGLVGYQNITSQYDVDDPTAALNSTAANLPFPVKNGSFIVHVRDTATGQETTRQIAIDLDGLGGNDTTLASLATALGGVPGLNASVTADNRLQLSAGNGLQVRFSEDSSDALAALGVGAFFTGTNAANIGIVSEVRADPRLIAASLTGADNDGDMAGRIAALAESGASSSVLSNRSITEFHTSMIGDLAVTGAAALTEYDSADGVHQGLYAQREALSGVSLDEEAINLSKFEKAFEGAARYVNVLNQLSDELLNLL
ncbi:MAG: flagellar hook-associated protein FlgK [Phycisphaerae bacterium]